MNRQVIEKQGPLMTEMIEGEPIRVGGRELTPLVRVTSRVQRQALVGSDRLTGQGWGFVRMQPVALLERSKEGERRISIQDETAQTLDRLFLAALVIPLLALIVLLARKISR
jgi:uncharacterized spore protein YtfJ